MRTNSFLILNHFLYYIYRNAPGIFKEEDLLALVSAVDYFSLMTYDYSSSQRPGPNSPIEWVQKCVEILDPEAKNRDRLLLGLNFYGNDYTINGGGPILGTQYIDILKNHSSVKFQWDDRSQEHFFEYKYDWPACISKRIIT